MRGLVDSFGSGKALGATNTMVKTTWTRPFEAKGKEGSRDKAGRCNGHDKVWDK